MEKIIKENDEILTVKDMIKKLLEHPMDWECELRTQKGNTRPKRKYNMVVRPPTSLGALFG